MVLATLLCVALSVALGWALYHLMKLRSRFAPVLSADAEAARILAAAREEAADLESKASEATSRAQRVVASSESELAALRARIESDTLRLGKLRAEIAAVEENIEDLSVGIYRPHFDFDTSEAYRQKLTAVVEQKKAVVRDGGAWDAPAGWTVNGNAREGAKMQKQMGKLMLRAFNGEADAAIARVAWNNVTRMEERIHKAFDAINGFGTVTGISVTAAYKALVLDELRLEYELAQKKQEEQEEQRQIREQMRDEQKAARELERARLDAAKEEDAVRRALEKVTMQLERATAEQRAQFEVQLVELNARLAVAEAKAQRALSMAQQTRSGHVYVLSNIGSFGEGVVKIGLTRRLDPLDRVKELGDASVPFGFDVHALVYSDDAPALEHALHKHFLTAQVNKVNPRKEFFRVPISVLKAEFEALGVDATWTLLAAAREYRETLGIEETMRSDPERGRAWLERVDQDYDAAAFLEADEDLAG